MSPLLTSILGWSLAAAVAAPAADPAAEAIEAAVEAELARALELRLPDQPPPWYVRASVIDGAVATVGTAFGERTLFGASPYRQARVEVRVGSRELDNAHFDMGYGNRSGLDARDLPDEPSVVAFRRELWLGLDQSYKGATEQYSSKLAAREGRTQDEAPLPSMYEEPARVLPPLAFSVPDAARLEAQVSAASRPFAALPWIEDGSAIGRVWNGRRYLADTEGMAAWMPAGLAVIRVEAVTEASDGARLRNARWWVGRTAEDLPELAELERASAELASWLEGLRDAPVERDYLGPVLFESAAAVELFRQLLHSEISGTPPNEAAPDPYNTEPAPAPRARKGRRLLPEGWWLVDDPQGTPGCAGSYTIDHEGVEAQRVEAIQDGVLRELLMSRRPREGEPGSTGHGRGLGMDAKAALPAAVTITPKRAVSSARMRRKALALARQAGLDYVLVVKRLTPPALAEDFQIAFTGDGPLAGLSRPLEVYRLYADGREEPVRGLRFLGVDRRALRDIALAGPTQPPVNVLDTTPQGGRYSLGAIGGLPACWAVPPVLITELELRGSGGQQTHVLPAP
jgi:hypothetical protein